MKVSAIANKGARERCDWSFVVIVWMDSGCVEIVRLLVTNNDKTGEQTHYGHYTRAGDLYNAVLPSTVGRFLGCLTVKY